MADDETHIGRNNEERKEDENRRIMGKALEGVAAETVQRFGSAIKEHLAAYAGDREKPADENSRPPKRGASFKNEREIRSGASPVLSVNS